LREPNLIGAGRFLATTMIVTSYRIDLEEQLASILPPEPKSDD
jgi:hypothetical protein